MKRILTSLTPQPACSPPARNEQHAEAPAPRPVLTVVVAPQTARTVGFAGTVEPRYKSDLGFRVLGRIISRDVNVGDSRQEGAAAGHARPRCLPACGALGASRPGQRHRATRECRCDRDPPAHAACRRTLPTRRSLTPPSRPASPRRRASRAPRRTSTRPRSNSATPSFAPTFDGVVTAVEAELGQVVQPGQTVALGGSPGHPRGGGRPAREHRAGSQAGSPLRHRPATRSLGAGCRIRAGDRSAGGSRHPHAAGEDHSRQPAGELPPRNDDHRNDHDAGCPGRSSCQSRPCWSGTAGRWSGSSIRPPGRCRPRT